MSELHPYQKEFMDALVGWEAGRLSIDFALPNRGVSKSVFQDLFMCRPMPAEPMTGLRGVTANTIVTDEISSGKITIDTMRKAMDRMTGLTGWDEENLYLDIETPLKPLSARELNGILPTQKPPTGMMIGGEWVAFSDIKAEYKNPDFPEADTYVILEKLDIKDPRNPNPAAGTQKSWFVLQGLKRQQVKNRTSGEGRAWSLHTKQIEVIKQRRRDAEREVERIATENAARLRSAPGFGGF